jgi:hypothetical protein
VSAANDGGDQRGGHVVQSPFRTRTFADGDIGASNGVWEIATRVSVLAREVRGQRTQSLHTRDFAARVPSDAVGNDQEHG